MSASPPPNVLPRLGRRGAGLALLALGGRPARAQGGAQGGAQGENPALLVPGPEDGALAPWAARAAAALARGLHRTGPLRTTHLGGADGVTAANRFATLDGTGGPHLLVLSGQTCHARLIGAARARFEPSAWLPLLANWQGAVLAGRGALLPPGPAALRVAIPSPEAPEAAALAALDLLNLPALPFPGQPEAAFAAGDADALIVAGPDAAARARAIGAVPWYTLSTPGESDGTQIPPLPPTSPEARGVIAAAAALQMRAALVMPPLTPADTIAAWRRAALRWQEEERTQPEGGQALTGTAAAAAFALLTPPPDAALSYRSWLERRLGWRAG